jgi:hypothetical protein
MAVRGVLSFGLTMAVHPAANAGPTLRAIYSDTREKEGEKIVRTVYILE